MKTPMQDIVDELKSELHISYNLPEEREYNSGLRAALVMAEGMLEKEKEVIMDAHKDGAFHTDWDEDTDVVENAQDYYNETFNTKEK